MYIDPYPYHAVIVYDDCDDATFIWGDDNLKQFLELQKSEAISVKRKNRRIFRALARSEELFELKFSRMESETVPDGTRTVTDKDGNSRQETVYSTVHFECYYTRGYIVVGNNTGGFLPKPPSTRLRF